MVFFIVAIILVVDQLTKVLVTRALTLHQSVPLLNNIFHLTLVYNTGAAFGLFKNQILLFIATSLCAIILVSYNLKKTTLRLPSVSLALILAGALGNLIDRLRFGFVIDFLDFRVWPVFNVADSAITIGAILLGWFLLRNNNSKH
ncbi:MAG: signal peptidase II [Candidatus Omnitrophica bacterium]|nr:signal peptidase II [Candidatus Omnitrophota bacterium]